MIEKLMHMLLCVYLTLLHITLHITRVLLCHLLYKYFTKCGSTLAAMLYCFRKTAFKKTVFQKGHEVNMRTRVSQNGSEKTLYQNGYAVNSIDSTSLLVRSSGRSLKQLISFFVGIYRAGDPNKSLCSTRSFKTATSTPASLHMIAEMWRLLKRLNMQSASPVYCTVPSGVLIGWERLASQRSSACRLKKK